MARIKIGDVLKRAREKQELKAEEVAARCDITRGQYYQWEAADHLLKKNIKRVAKALGLSEAYLTRINNGGRDNSGEQNEAQSISAA